jgi:hypothetical protein
MDIGNLFWTFLPFMALQPLIAVIQKVRVNPSVEFGAKLVPGRP